MKRSPLFLAVYGFSLFCCLLNRTAYSQYITDWQKCLGGSSDDGATAMVQPSDGGFAVAGWVLSYDGDVFGNHDTSGRRQRNQRRCFFARNRYLYSEDYFRGQSNRQEIY